MSTVSSWVSRQLANAHCAHWRHFFAVGALMLLTAVAYWPGLAGGFLFDDYANLPALGRYGGVHDWQSFTWYLTSGIADPTGRPIAMLSFLLDANDWPADPAPFKRTNLFLHLINGALVYVVLAALGKSVSLTLSHSRLAAAFAAGFWLLHPLWVSTVLYVIQRHAMLAALFALCAIATWIASRDAFSRERVRSGWLLAMLAVPLLGLLAGFSKANGFLLPLLLAILEITVLQHGRMASRAGRHFHIARWALVFLPALLTIGVIVGEGVRVADGMVAARGWTIWERLMTEARVLVEYLRHLFVPGLSARGVFADNYVVSTGLLDPWTTLPAMLAITGLIVASVIWRGRYPAIAAAVLFYFAGHAMESSVIPLELYFEHRNYLPAVLLFWPLALWLTSQHQARRASIAGGFALLVLLAGLTAVQAKLWNSPLDLANAWADAQPTSPRAQAYAASFDMAAGRAPAAIARLEPLARARPDEPQYSLSLLNARCRAGFVPDANLLLAEQALAARGVGLDMSNQWIVELLSPAGSADCAGLPAPSIIRLAQAAKRWPATSDEHRSRVAYLDGLLAIRQGDCDQALTHFNARLAFMRRPEFAHSQIGILATHCDAAKALTLLDSFLASPEPYTRPPNRALRMRDWVMARDGYWEEEWIRLRGVLQLETAVPRTTDPNSPH